jgi:hypothetical protein
MWMGGVEGARAHGGIVVAKSGKLPIEMAMEKQKIGKG